MLPSINSVLTLHYVAFCPVAFLPSGLLSYGLLSVAFCLVAFCTVAFCRDPSEWHERYNWVQTTTEHDVVWRIWAGDHGELFFCVHLNREWQFHRKSNELTDAFLACPPDWARGPPLPCAERDLPLPGSRTMVPVLRIFFSKLSIPLSFQPLSGNSLNALRAPYCFVR